MNLDEIRREKAELEQRHGAWTAHNVCLADGLYTIGPGPSGDETKLRRVVQLVADLGGPIERLRILDLACLEGMYALELAARGAEVVGIEGREANIEKARFAARVLGLENVYFELGDVRALSPERHGRFDVVLCLGILYHLDASDAFRFVDQIGEVCHSIAVFDTWVALAPEETRRHAGREYHGVSLFEHEPDASESDRGERLWSSLDNPSAFAPTLPSLLRLLDHAGFTSALECHLPPEGDKPEGRLTLVAVKGSRQRPRLTPEPATSFPAEPARARTRPLGDLVGRTRSFARRALRRRLRQL